MPPLGVEVAVVVVVAVVIQERMRREAEVRAALAAVRAQRHSTVVVKTISGGRAIGPDQ